MAKGLFVTATGTDAGKTYITALLVKKLSETGLRAGYYKAALSGAETIAESDAGYVKRISGIDQPEESLLSYLYRNSVSPHLAARIEGNPVEPEKVRADFAKVAEAYDYVTVEGSGGIVCPIRWDEQKLLLEDIIKELGLDTVIVADAGLGTINAVVLTVSYLKSKAIGIRGIILNHYSGDVMQEDNIRMIEELTGIPVVAVVHDGDDEIEISPENLCDMYGEISVSR